jgi:hypothetical protein
MDCAAVAIDERDPTVSPPAEIVAALQELSDLPRNMVTVGGTHSAHALRQQIQIKNLYVAGFSGSELIKDERNVGHAGAPLASKMIDNIGRWIQSDLTPFKEVSVQILPLSIKVDLSPLNPAKRDAVRQIVDRVLDKFRATVSVAANDKTIDASWSLAGNSARVVETLEKESHHESPLICCMASHPWMSDALLATQSRGGLTFCVNGESSLPVQYKLASPAVAEFLGAIVQRLKTA